ncbi:MAG: hypothetical protein IJ871_08975, partial [Ruminococcus sp.]|nr:hypothetical protein [Ruminococcus sp.]
AVEGKRCRVYGSKAARWWAVEGAEMRPKRQNETADAVKSCVRLYIKFKEDLKMKYYTVEIQNIRFGDIRRVTVKASSAEEAYDDAVVFCGERIIAVWRL